MARGGGRGRGAGRLHPGGRRAVDPADQRAHDRPRASTSSWRPAARRWCAPPTAAATRRSASARATCRCSSTRRPTSARRRDAHRRRARPSTTRSCARTSRVRRSSRRRGGRPFAAALRARGRPHALDGRGRDRVRDLIFPDRPLRHRVGRQVGAAEIADGGRRSRCPRTPGSSSRRSTSSCPRRCWRTRSSARCWAWSGRRAPPAGSTRRAPCCASPAPATRAAIHSDGPTDDHGLRRRGPRAARVGQRGQQPRQLRDRDEPGSVDDDRHGLLRSLVGGREPASPSTW